MKKDASRRKFLKNLGLGSLSIAIFPSLIHSKPTETETAKAFNNNTGVNPDEGSSKYASWSDNQLTLDNGVIKRVIHYDPRKYTLATSKLSFQGSDFSFVRENGREKFPNGLQPGFSHIKKKGLRRGLWISLVMASKYSEVYRENAGWFILGKQGQPICVHSESSRNVTACMTTGWYSYIKDVISDKVE